MKKALLIIPFFIVLCLSGTWMKAKIQDDAPEYAPDFTLPDTAGNDFTLSSLRGK
jgi:cytochrome oxidase Cu insertion factor (SCO1/SenC/PrrC family)